MQLKTKTLLAVSTLGALTLGQAGAAVYFYDFGSQNHGGGTNAPAATGATGIYYNIAGPPNVYTPQTVNFAEGTLEISAINSWSTDSGMIVGNDYIFIAADSGLSTITFTINLNDTSGNTTATAELWHGGLNTSGQDHFYSGNDVGGNPFTLQTTTNGNAAVDQSSGVTPALGHGAVITVTSSDTDLRVGGIRITTTTIPEPSTGVLLGLIGCLAAARRRRR